LGLFAKPLDDERLERCLGDAEIYRFPIVTTTNGSIEFEAERKFSRVIEFEDVTIRFSVDAPIF
jgi:hypothetical protein